MSLGVQSPRRSALGLTWCEDVTRGRLGVRKNGGDIVETPPNVVNIQGKWAEFPGDASAYIEYPATHTLYQSAVTFGCRVKDLVDVADDEVFLSQYHSAFVTDRSLSLLHNGTTLTARLRISGVLRTVSGVVAELLDQEGDIVATWADGLNFILYYNGVQAFSVGPYASDLSGTIQALTLGAYTNHVKPLTGKIADPFIDLGHAWNADEVLQYHNKSLLV
jgi:hypothetical protein